MNLPPASFPPKGTKLKTPAQALDACQEVRNKLKEINKYSDDYMSIISPVLQASAWLGIVEQFFMNQIVEEASDEGDTRAAQ